MLIQGQQNLIFMYCVTFMSCTKMMTIKMMSVNLFLIVTLFYWFIIKVESIYF